MEAMVVSDVYEVALNSRILGNDTLSGSPPRNKFAVPTY